MEAAVLLWFHLLLSVIFCNGFHVQGPSGSLTVQLGDSVMLPCFVETPPPMEELEVEWKRIDSGSLVHLWQNGESRPESQNQRYHERAHFFSEEVAHGNFSLVLTNVTQEDAGVYKCVVHTNQLSDETLIEIMEIKRLIVSGGHVISAYAGEEITLNCSVDSHIPSEKIEEVSWKTDEGILVLLYQNSTVQTESTHGRFKGRVEFFSTEDRNKGNFSMRLKDVRTEDKGLYICSAFSGNLSDNTTVEVQQVGFSSMHIWIIVLCIIGFVIGSVILGYFSYTSFQKKDNSRRARVLQCAHVLYPNIMMSIVFILWGVTEGFLTEAATCSALNFVRIIFLFWIAVHLKSVEDYVHEVMDRLAVLLQYIVITVVAYSPIIVDLWNKRDNIWKVQVLTFLFLGSLLVSLHAVTVVCYRRNLQKVSDQSYVNTEITNFLRGAIIWTYSFQLNHLPVLLFPLLAIICFKVCVNFKCPIPVLHFVSVLLILQIMSVSGSIYIHYDLVTNMKGVATADPPHV